MSVVADASVLVAAAVDAGADGAWAEATLSDGDVVCPHLGLVEATTILRRLERTGQLTPVEATAAFHDLLRLPLVGVPFEPFAERIWALRGTVTSYDAWYVAVAEAFRLPLATLDRRLARAAGPTCRFRCPD